MDIKIFTDFGFNKNTDDVFSQNGVDLKDNGSVLVITFYDVNGNQITGEINKDSLKYLSNSIGDQIDNALDHL